MTASYLRSLLGRLTQLRFLKSTNFPKINRDLIFVDNHTVDIYAFMAKIEKFVGHAQYSSKDIRNIYRKSRVTIFSR